MCYAIPGKVGSVKEKNAIVDYFGEHRNVLNEFSDIKSGDYVYAQGGIIIDKIDEQDALLILKAWKNRFFKLKQIDTKITQKDDTKISNKKFENILKKAAQGKKFAKKELLLLLKTEKQDEINLLCETANKIRQQHLKNSCCVHGIIEFSNYCRNNCQYCGIRNDNKQLSRYRMTVDEIVSVADYAVNKLKFKALVLQAGEDLWYTTERLVEIITKIKEKCGVLLSMSIGERDSDCYKKMYEAGARGILLRFETSNKKIYNNIHSGPKTDFQKRMQLIKEANKIGYLVATGSLIGLPEQKEDDLLNDILLTTSLNAEMYSFGPLIPHPETPMASSPRVDINTMLKVIAVSRLINPEAKILVTTALETLDKKNGKRLGLLAGANSLMINVTPERYKGLYTIYPSKAGADKTVNESIKETLQTLYELGRAPTDIG